MNSTPKIIGIAFTMMMVFSGCTSQTYVQSFDKEKAAKTRVSLGLTYLKNGNFSQAKFNLDKALKFAPRSADANFAIAYYYQSVSELELAENSFQFAMDLEPENANIANSYGAFLCQNGNYEKAQKYFLKAVNTSSYASSAETYENLALCSRDQGRPEETIQFLRSAVNHQPRRASSLYLLAQSLIEIKQWQEAKVIFSRYEKTSQISPQSLLMALRIESGMGNESASKGYLDTLRRLFPNDPVTKIMAIEQPSSFETVNKLVSRPVTSEAVVSKPAISIASSGKNESEKIIISSNRAKNNVAFVESGILDNPDVHIVVGGENLYRISLRYNIKMQRLIEWNSLVDASSIYNGKKLSLVAPSAIE
jgi:type IV pilus assembly protein PilF